MKLEDDLIDAAWRVKFAASRDGARPVLQQVFFSTGWVWATDSYRIAAVEVDVDEGWQEFAVPAGVLFDMAEGATVSVRGRSVKINGHTHEWYPLVAGEKFLPPPAAAWLSEPVDRAAWITRVQEATTEIDRHGTKHKVVTVHNGDIGRGSVAAILKASWLIEGLRACPDDTIRLAASDTRSPVVVHGAEFMYVQMPIAPLPTCDSCTPGPVRVATWGRVAA